MAGHSRPLATHYGSDIDPRIAGPVVEVLERISCSETSSELVRGTGKVPGAAPGISKKRPGLLHRLGSFLSDLPPEYEPESDDLIREVQEAREDLAGLVSDLTGTPVEKMADWLEGRKSFMDKEDQR